VAADSDTVCPALVTDRDLARWMPVYGYEVDYGDPWPHAATVPSGSSHVAAWSLTPVAGLDANDQLLQAQEVADVSTFARTGNPTAHFEPAWPQFNTTAELMSLAPGDDSQVMSVAQIALDHNCGFWDEVAPKP
jgi:para-nitrobenzyl esterase